MAATISTSLALTTEYSNTDFSRKYKINDITGETMYTIQDKIEAFNQSLEGGTAGGVSSVFISDDFDSSTGTGYLTKINRMEIVSTELTDIEWK